MRVPTRRRRQGMLPGLGRGWASGSHCLVHLRSCAGSLESTLALSSQSSAFGSLRQPSAAFGSLLQTAAAVKSAPHAPACGKSRMHPQSLATACARIFGGPAPRAVGRRPVESRPPGGRHGLVFLAKAAPSGLAFLPIASSEPAACAGSKGGGLRQPSAGNAVVRRPAPEEKETAAEGRRRSSPRTGPAGM